MTQALHHLRSIRANFGVPESQIIVPPFRIPDLWPEALVVTVTRTLSGFLSEYRIGDESALPLQCCFVLLAGRSCMRPKVIRQVEIPTPSYGGGRSWMA